MTNEDSENKSDNADRCPECGSNETESGDTHEYCSDCGKQLEPLELDPGFVPGNPNAPPGIDLSLIHISEPTRPY